MFEKWAYLVAGRIKAVNPDETAPHDVLVFGFTIIFNLLFTVTIIMTIGWVLGIPLLLAQITISFMFLRILTGGAHLDQSLACSLTSMSLVILSALLPSSSIYLYSYVLLSLFFLLRYAPYYEAHQLVHSQEWERKKKLVAILWVLITLMVYYFFDQYGFILGVFLQAVLITPAGIKFTHKLNRITNKGGEQCEENS